MRPRKKQRQGRAYVVDDALVTKCRLVLGEGNTGDLAAVVLVCERSEGSPSTTDVEKVILGLEVELASVDN